jgi:hypothetical protein
MVRDAQLVCDGWNSEMNIRQSRSVRTLYSRILTIPSKITSQHENFHSFGQALWNEEMNKNLRGRNSALMKKKNMILCFNSNSINIILLQKLGRLEEESNKVEE